ncbi:hypothetical protein ACOJA8_14025, partial [Corynebacterium striatum]|uniref:hypothetical protein n=1 Tax=Corynebacterium striatum TaxID=43770 RepID=UPI003B5B27F2
GQGEFVPIDFEKVVKARTGRTKQTLQVLWARYTTTPAGPGQRCRFVVVGTGNPRSWYRVSG